MAKPAHKIVTVVLLNKTVLAVCKFCVKVSDEGDDDIIFLFIPT